MKTPHQQACHQGLISMAFKPSPPQSTILPARRYALPTLATIFSLAMACLTSLATPAQADENKWDKQNLPALRNIAEHFLKEQSSTLPGKVSIEVGSVDQRLSLPACAAPQAFLPPGSRAWGKTTVGVRCNNPSAWKIFIQANVKVQGDYVAAAAPLAAGQAIQANQLLVLQGEISSMPAGILTDMQAAIGRVSAYSVAAGAPLRQDGLRNQQVISSGQLVKLVSSGPGFSVSSEARAINNASDGQLVQVKTASGQQISGIAQAGGVVKVSY